MPNLIDLLNPSSSKREMPVSGGQTSPLFQTKAFGLIAQANAQATTVPLTPFELLSHRTVVTSRKELSQASVTHLTEAVSVCREASHAESPLAVLQKSEETVRECFETSRVEPPDVVRLFFMVTTALMVRTYVELEDFQQQIKHLQGEESILHQKKAEELNKQVLREQSESRWSTASKIFSLMVISIGILAGIFLCASGNPVAGAMLIVAGVVQLTNHILKETGGWTKIIDMLPGDDPDKKRAIATWMQLGITVLSIMLAGAGGVMAGKAAISEGMSMANMFTTSTLLTAMGICAIGQGISGYNLYNSRASLKACDLEMTKLSTRRQDLMEREEAGISFIKGSFDSFGSAFQMQQDLNDAYQSTF